MNRMTPTQARHTRRAVLQAVVDTSARCNSMDTEMWFRGDGESTADWQTRRTTALRLCTGCPVRAVCEELALRNGDGEPDADDMIRAGYTGPELAAIRDHHAVRLAVAIDRDRDTEGRLLTDLTTALHAEVALDPDDNTAEQDLRISALAASIREIRTDRRARAGWGTAA